MNNKLSHAAGSWIVGAAFFITMAFGTLPTPLYALYQQRDGFSTFTLTVVFAGYAFGVMASLYLAGHLSDRLGRRRVALAAVLLELLSAGIFLLWPEVPGLILARFVSGLGVGVITATATAHVAELRQLGRPGEHPRRASMLSTAANLGGLAVGPLIAGLLAQYVRSPLTTPYVVFVLLLAISALGLALVPETVTPPAERVPYRPQRVSVPREARGTFLAAGAGVVSAFAILGLFTSVAPTFLSGTLHETSRVLAGAVPFAVFAAAALSQIVLSAMTVRNQLKLGTALMAAGLVAIAAAVVFPSLALFVVGGIVAGAGVGLVFRTSVASAASLATPDSRGEVLAAIFLVGYSGLSLPVMAIGLALLVFPTTVVLPAFALLALLGVLYSATRLLAPPPAPVVPTAV
ncbi:MFS transporter [Kribbella sp. NBC_01245]|uniref:MFS transporter n=1 Tax=Kribbella sp. NBC_01245 TaxID=2903578 RepID=UPI002E285AA0|nr:MFS transporter [Kribbella sp. NBC_01245]